MSKKGEPADCDAPPGKCPLGGDHYDDFESAKAGIDARLADEYGAVQSLSRKSRKALNPDKATVEHDYELSYDDASNSLSVLSELNPNVSTVKNNAELIERFELSANPNRKTPRDGYENHMRPPNLSKSKHERELVREIAVNTVNDSYKNLVAISQDPKRPRDEKIKEVEQFDRDYRSSKSNLRSSGVHLETFNKERFLKSHKLR